MMPPALKQAANQAELFKKTYGSSVLKTCEAPGFLGQLHYAQTSEGLATSVVFVHGSPGAYDGFSTYLSNTNLQAIFNLYAIDRPGFGGTNPGVPERSLENQVAYLKPLLDKIDGKTILVGHSFGGPYILRAALDFPDEVDGLIVVAGSVDPELENMKWFNHLANTKLAKAIIPSDFFVSNQEILGLESELRILEPLLSKLQVPVMVLQGVEDTLVPVGNADYIEKHLAHVSPSIQKIEGEGHFILWSHSELVIDALMEFREMPYNKVHNPRLLEGPAPAGPRIDLHLYSLRPRRSGALQGKIYTASQL